MTGDGKARDARIWDHPVLGPPPARPTVRFLWNGEDMEALEGEPIAAALLAAGERTLRTTHRSGRPRGVYCNIGHCYECRVFVEGLGSVRACLTPVPDGGSVWSSDPAGEGS